MKKIKEFAELAIIIFILFIGWNYLRDSKEEPIIKKEVVIKTLTLNPPKIEVNFTFDKPKQILYIPLPNRFDSLTRQQLIDSLTDAKTTRVYQDSIVNDTLAIRVSAKVEGRLKNLFISYQMKNIKHEFEETTTTITKQTKGRLLIGLGATAGGLEYPSANINIGYQNAKGSMISIGYNSNGATEISYYHSLIKW